GAAREYELGGDPQYRDIATFFWDRVVHHRTYVMGGNSDGEAFFPEEEFSKHLGASGPETCNTYNMLKLTRHIFEWSPSADAMDFYERGLFNHILPSQDPETGMVLYYCPLKPGAWKSFSTPDDSFWCCVGTGMENHAKYGDTIYFHDDRSLYVNLFIPSELTWKEHGLVVRQETRFPEEDATHLTLTTKSPVRLALKVRYPGWAQSGMIVSVNGKPVSIAETRGSYATIDREWTSGDRVDIRLPMTLRTEAMPDDPKMIAVMYGPIVLAGDLGRDGLDSIKRYGPSAPQVGRVKTPTIPVFIGDVASVPSKIAPVAGARLHFATNGLAQPREVSLVPLYQIVDQRYTVYWKVLSSAEWTARKTELAALDAKRKDIDARAIDTVVVNDANSERDHRYTGENATEGYFEGRRTREARSGWFSYVLNIPADRAVTLVCTYRGSEGRRHSFDVMVDGEKVAAESLEYHPTEELDREYAVPESLTRGKDHVTVRFQARDQSTAGAVLAVRTSAGSTKR
ncbi:MAG TPA: beta-L-arabinofuranosidase domain-containing protein, partial [Gemmatimonadaceae bacterium]